MCIFVALAYAILAGVGRGFDSDLSFPHLPQDPNF